MLFNSVYILHLADSKHFVDPLDLCHSFCDCNHQSILGFKSLSYLLFQRCVWHAVHLTSFFTLPYFLITLPGLWIFKTHTQRDHCPSTGPTDFCDFQCNNRNNWTYMFCCWKILYLWVANHLFVSRRFQHIQYLLCAELTL